MAESRAERKARRALIEAAEGSEEKKSSTKSKSSKAAKSKPTKSRAKTKRSDSRRGGDKAPQTRSKRSHKDRVSSARKAVDPKSPCSIMKSCGGCTALNRPYKKQLAAKQAAMEELFASLCEREGIAVDPIRGMGVTLGDPGKYPAPRGFRHKAATPFAPGKEGAVRCGFFERGTHKIVAVPECPVEAPGARQILNGIAREAERLHIPAFNEDKHLGLLRYAVVRCGWRTDQVMVTLVTAQRDLPHAQEFFEAVAALDPRIVTVAQNINGRPGNAILGEETRIVYGAECMRDQLLGCEFDISPTAFYQTNPQQTELLYQLAIDGMDLRQGDVLMDAYCGSGTIGLCAAKDAQNKGIGIMLLGVERNPAGIADARRNAEFNGLTRSAWFMADDATDYILDAADNNERIDVLSIDPPRAGSTPEFLEAACALKPRRITYISCNPVTQDHARRHVPSHRPHRNRSGPRTPLTNLSRFLGQERGRPARSAPLAWFINSATSPCAGRTRRLPPSRAAASRDRASRSDPTGSESRRASCERNRAYQLPCQCAHRSKRQCPRLAQRNAQRSCGIQPNAQCRHRVQDYGC